MRLAIAVLMFASVAFAGPPHLVRDINTTIIPVDSIPGELLDQGSWSFFTAGDGTHARAVVHRWHGSGNVSPGVGESAARMAPVWNCSQSITTCRS